VNRRESAGDQLRYVLSDVMFWIRWIVVVYLLIGLFLSLVSGGLIFLVLWPVLLFSGFGPGSGSD
jgi:hypothetical protein